MDEKTVVIILGLILIIAGIVLMAYTESAGTPGSDPSFGIADVSEDIRPYFWYGIAFLALGVILMVLAVVKY